MRNILLVLLVARSVSAAAPPIIDMHLHAEPAATYGPPPVVICSFESWPVVDPKSGLENYGQRFNSGEWCTNPLQSARDDASLMKQSIAALEKRNVYAVASGEDPAVVKRWQAASPRIMPALGYSLTPSALDIAAVRSLFEKKEMVVFGEITNHYFGIAPDDPRFEPFWAMAEELDVPVGIHLGPGPPGTPYLAPPFANARAALHSPLTLEPVLRKHPRLRIYMMHAGWPMLDDTIVMLYTYPQLYVDIAILNHAYPIEEFYRYLKALVTAGFGKRILFGSDQMVWPQVIEVAIDRVESAPFLTAGQKRDIFYNNAARFLRLSEQEMRRHREGK